MGQGARCFKRGAKLGDKTELLLSLSLSLSLSLYIGQGCLQTNIFTTHLPHACFSSGEEPRVRKQIWPLAHSLPLSLFCLSGEAWWGSRELHGRLPSWILAVVAMFEDYCVITMPQP